MFVGNLLTTLRMSIGDFGFDSAIVLDPAENIIYWFTWLLIVLITSIIFINFLISEAGASYEKVSADLDAFIMSEKASLIQESEEMKLEQQKHEGIFPRFIVTREKED